MSSVETGQMSAVETGQLFAAEKGQISAVETRQIQWFCFKEQFYVRAAKTSAKAAHVLPVPLKLLTTRCVAKTWRKLV